MKIYDIIDDETIGYLSEDDKNLAIFLLMEALDYHEFEARGDKNYEQEERAKITISCYEVSSGEASDFMKRIRLFIRDLLKETSK